MVFIIDDSIPPSPSAQAAPADTAAHEVAEEIKVTAVAGIAGRGHPTAP
ncbi:MAG: hypothetical protein ABI253_10170 [Mycobacterium sp.]